jgi:hypothetical protein
MMRPYMVLGMIFLMTPTPLWADEASGTITGTIGEVQVNISIWKEQSDFYGDGNSGGVSIMTKPLARNDGLGTLAIGFEGSNFTKGDFTHFEITIGDAAAENRSEYFANLDHDLQVLITRAEKRDESLFIGGSVRGTLIWRQLMPISERNEQPSRQLPVELDFDVNVANEL